MNVRGSLYRAGSAMGNVRAVTTGRVPQRLVRVAAYRSTGRALRAGGCLVPCVAFCVAAALAACSGSGSGNDGAAAPEPVPVETTTTTTTAPTTTTNPVALGSTQKYETYDGEAANRTTVFRYRDSAVYGDVEATLRKEDGKRSVALEVRVCITKAPAGDEPPRD
jgi:hypothetical protein